ncbi:putative bifunctional diguanylate cyclase/phosphodiesterase [Acinetobacter larvae]|uniref:GGDEF domain-containing protein n=1 Tax=Acinetobacter larvae TaxID=1789224 RepID=A0A1B2M1I3_9GAMM|nr:EAL domain-containing protein [Acinetobacter larvae]AOA59045.1 hypothetical protein BFG52_12255 [Acinetobacter larvae]
MLKAHEKSNFSHQIAVLLSHRTLYLLQLFIIWLVLSIGYNLILSLLGTDYFTSFSIIYSLCSTVVLGLSFAYLAKKTPKNAEIPPCPRDSIYDQGIIIVIALVQGFYYLAMYSYYADAITHVHALFLFLWRLPENLLYILVLILLKDKLPALFLYLIFTAIAILYLISQQQRLVFDSFDIILLLWLSMLLLGCILSLFFLKRNHSHRQPTRIPCDLSSAPNSVIRNNTTAHATIENMKKSNNKQSDQDNSISDPTHGCATTVLSCTTCIYCTPTQPVDPYTSNHLRFAHQIASMNAWVWNIQKSHFEINSKPGLALLSPDNEKFQQLIHPDDRADYRHAMKQHLLGKTPRFEMIYRLRSGEDWHWIQDIGQVTQRDQQNNPIKMIGLFRDFQQEQNDQAQLKLGSIIFHKLKESVFILDQHLRYLQINSCYEKLLGLDKEHVVGQYLFHLCSKNEYIAQQHHQLIIEKLRQDGEYAGEITEKLASGKELVLRLRINAIRDEQQQISHYVGIISDLTQQKQQEQRVRYLENYDLLTNLPNRFYFNLKLNHYISSTSAIQRFALIRIRIDRFGVYNELNNQLLGDGLIQLVAQRLNHLCQNVQLLAYLNNDDFAIIYELDNAPVYIQQFLDKLFAELKIPYHLYDSEHILNFSIGVALYPEHGQHVDELNNNAQYALYEAQRIGGNAIRYYHNHDHFISNDQRSLKYDLQQVLIRNQLVVYYQPKICSLTQSLYGFEALVRWQHPIRGLIPPALFIPMAEESSLISDIGKFVISESCKQLKQWRLMGYNQIHISVNIVAQQILRGELLKDIDSALAEYGIAGEQLELELTESSLLDQSDAVLELLNNLKQRGINFSLDDFGRGYSSLSYLAQYPIDILKIDKAFIAKIGHAKDEAIVDAIIAMGDALDMIMVAEGVETAAQVEYLKSRGCYILQGFYFAKPLSAAESSAYLKQFKLDNQNKTNG